MKSHQTFSPRKYKCRHCNDIIWSSYSGEFVRCSCGAIYVDQTKYYIRCGGDLKDFIDIKEDNGT